MGRFKSKLQETLSLALGIMPRWLSLAKASAWYLPLGPESRRSRVQIPPGAPLRSLRTLRGITQFYHLIQPSSPPPIPSQEKAQNDALIIWVRRSIVVMKPKFQDKIYVTFYYSFDCASVAQRPERQPCKLLAAGSNPARGSILPHARNFYVQEGIHFSSIKPSFLLYISLNLLMMSISSRLKGKSILLAFGGITSILCFVD